VSPFVTEDQYARVCVDVDLSAEPMAGFVHAGDGRSERFCGWLALTRAIEETVDAARNARTQPNDGSDG
jgi:hypothetical protein